MRGVVGDAAFHQVVSFCWMNDEVRPNNELLPNL
jgi:hypothetical protein